MTAGLLRALVDVDQEADEWGANCGPAALAAALDLERVGDLREAFEPFHGYTNIPKMRDAIRRARARIVRQWSDVGEFGVLSPAEGSRLVLMLQWSGPWNSVPRAAATYRHCVALVRLPSGTWVGDVNTPGTWSLAAVWLADVPPLLAPKRWDGKVLVAWAADVRGQPAARDSTATPVCVIVEVKRCK
jgi:hypothetical protein